MEKKIFWSDNAHLYHHKDGVKFKGGIYFRSFDLNKFIQKVEKEEGEVVGLCFEGNNVDVIVKDTQTDNDR